MALKGNLRDFSTTQLLNLINLARKTGTLTIESGQEAQMSFKDGKLIYASLGRNQGSLAQILHQNGKLSGEQARIIHARAGDASDKQLGHMLIQRGIVTQSDIIQSVRQYILDVVYKLFTWADGLFRFDAAEAPPSNRITIPIELDSVIMEGSRRLKEWERLQEELPDLDVTLKFTDKPDARLRNISLTVEEWRVISLINPRNTMQQIAKANNLSDFEIRRIVYGLLQAGIVQPIRAAVRQPEAVAVDQSSRRASRTAPPDPSPSEKRSIVTRLISRIRKI
ncbi:MAG: DUF4388 domain-containing protein [Anaerolineales bacterium]|nr:DUF4388 domain-containing protein [Anaerolineales bacterium]MCB8960541.1 DUF4388 domain-containing protein [Ardenticatenales bacterium]MCB0005276.1 DUF4388 domain-containing protein [Anaerolineales bacterium]MCB0011045.1 DUF4388 domain-containing protein [Anaerolineales bacterium]MCB0016803.1 DUF4388 domain-containing protein [Anaerolineales bacterium]